MIFGVDIVVSLKPVVNDPQGLVVRQGLHQLGFEGVREVRVGKHITLQVDARDARTAHNAAIDMCEKLLCNPVIEEYTVSVQQSTVGAGSRR